MEVKDTARAGSISQQNKWACSAEHRAISDSTSFIEMSDEEGLVPLCRCINTHQGPAPGTKSRYCIHLLSDSSPL